MPILHLTELDSDIESFILKKQPYALEGIKDRLEKIKEQHSTPQLERVLDKIQIALLPPPSNEPDEDMNLLIPLLDKLENKLL